MNLIEAVTFVAEAVSKRKITISRAEGVSDGEAEEEAIGALRKALKRRSDNLQEARRAAALASLVGGIIASAKVSLDFEGHFDDSGGAYVNCTAGIELFGADGALLESNDEVDAQLELNDGHSDDEIRTDDIEGLFSSQDADGATLVFVVTLPNAEKLFQTHNYEEFLETAKVSS